MIMIQSLVGVASGQQNENLGTATTSHGTGRIGVRSHLALMRAQHVDGKYTNNMDKSSHVSVCL